MTTRYVTEYALTKGILELRGEVSDSGYFRPQGYFPSCSSRDHHPDLASARRRVVEMITAKIASHEKAIKKLRAMKPEEMEAVKA